MLFHMDTFLTILIDILAWFFIHMGVSYLMAHKSRYCFNPEGWLYRQRSWECNSSLYYKWFHVHQWKNILPDGADLFKFGFQKKHLKELNEAYFQDFIHETCRAELTHWIVFLFGFIFFAWNFWWVGIVMVIYAFAANMPCIVTQRYNRIRLRNVLGEIKKKAKC
jgi:glycosyl-4,4'-diaponeurosporenoate acyltransferase